jgi:hypothetical protein
VILYRTLYSSAGCLLLGLVLLLAAPAVPRAQLAPAASGQVVSEFLLLLLGSDSGRREALDFIDRQWRPDFAPMLVEALTFSRDPVFAEEMLELLQDKTGQSLGIDIPAWQHWLWNRDPQLHPLYGEYKSALYGLIDERFEAYFGADHPARIRLDEVVWGGVLQDGIPPLREPSMIAAADANYLAESDVIFGLVVGSQPRAYPRRILGWHEMFVDEIAGVPVAGVYCTLCGSMILYRTEVGGVRHELGTSGFLYRSNKLMYDRATSSLWNTLWGEPVIGPLTGQGIALQRMPVVTTTWGEWHRRHPATRVLSLQTGHSRDYSEGAAYRDYFATDELMFPVPALDTRLRNKDEVLGLVFPGSPREVLAISAAYLSAHPLYHDSVGQVQLVVLTDRSGASRVYESSGVEFAEFDRDTTVIDKVGVRWRLGEDALVAADGRRFRRLPAHRAFWFGWYSAYNHTRLVN